jgi:hypothetical protein
MKMKAQSLAIALLSSVVFHTAANALIQPPTLLFSFQGFEGDYYTPPTTVTGTQTGNTTTITSDDNLVEINNINGTYVGVTATYDLIATSTGAATTNGAEIEEPFSGSFSVTHDGINYLSATFSGTMIDQVTGYPLLFSNLSSGDTSITFTSDIIGLAFTLNNEVIPDYYLAFYDFSPEITDNTLASFSSPLWTGQFGSAMALATPTPEPSTVAMLVIGFAGLGFAAYRKPRTAR